MYDRYDVMFEYIYFLGMFLVYCFMVIIIEIECGEVSIDDLFILWWVN